MIMRVFTAHEHENSPLNIGISTWVRREGVYDWNEVIIWYMHYTIIDTRYKVSDLFSPNRPDRV